jgi:hypothetical protein
MDIENVGKKNNHARILQEVAYLDALLISNPFSSADVLPLTPGKHRLKPNLNLGREILRSSSTRPLNFEHVLIKLGDLYPVDFSTVQDLIISRTFYRQCQQWHFTRMTSTWLNHCMGKRNYVERDFFHSTAQSTERQILAPVLSSGFGRQWQSGS